MYRFTLEYNGTVYSLHSSGIDKAIDKAMEIFYGADMENISSDQFHSFLSGVKLTSVKEVSK